jgi:ABC-2 type transport system permease protein
MRQFFILLRKELRSFFLSPLAWMIIALFTFLNGWLFSGMVQAMAVSVNQHSLVYNLFDSGWFWMGYFFLFPLLTMRLFAEEKKLGTLESLFTAPVRTSQVVLAKYLATAILYIVVMLPIFGFFFVFEDITGEQAAFEPGSFYGAAAILLLLGLFNIAIGCLASSLTSNQLIAAMVTFVVTLVHYFLGTVLYHFGANLPSQMLEKITYFSTIEHRQTFTSGLIDSRPLVYYLSTVILILFLTHHVLEKRRWQA